MALNWYKDKQKTLAKYANQPKNYSSSKLIEKLKSLKNTMGGTIHPSEDQPLLILNHKIAYCKNCSSPCHWAVTPYKKFILVNQNYKPHWTSCDHSIDELESSYLTALAKD